MAAQEEDERTSAQLMPLDVPTLLFERALSVGAAELTAEEVALLLIALRGPDIRDVALLQWAYGPEYGDVALLGADLLAAARVLGLDAASIPDEASTAAGAEFGGTEFGGTEFVATDSAESARAAVTDPGDANGPGRTAFELSAESARRLSGEGPGPDAHRVRQAIELLLDVVALAPLSVRPAPLTMLSWLSWAIGLNTRAECFAKRALAVDQEYGLAALMMMMLDHGRYPEWLFTRADESSTR